VRDKTAHGSDQGDAQKGADVSKERQKILDDMYVQMRKSRDKIDKSLLDKVKAFIFSNPTLRKSFGVKRDEVVEVKADEPIDRAKNIDVVAKFLEMHPDRKADVSKILKD